MSNDLTPPIEVTNETTTTTLASALRTLLVAIGSFAVGRGWVEAENVEGIVTLAVTLGTAGYGVFKAYTRKRQLIVTADAAPNTVAVVKG